MIIDFAGQSVVVTGGGSGMGAAACRALDTCGARVAVLDRDHDAAKAMAAQLGDAVALTADISDAQAVSDAFDTAVSTYGQIDAVIHAAGVDDPVVKNLVAEQVREGRATETMTQIDDSQWQRMININLSGSFYVLRAALGHMMHGRQGAVVLIGSEAGAHAVKGLPHYSASKGGVHALVRAASLEAISYGVRVNGVAPGVIDTPMSQRSKGTWGGSASPVFAPIGRMGLPEEVANVALFLASSLASYIVGEVVNVNGGRLCA
jgi:NAD(P)-dependent dehydrogenase (short-subunit alcohol dehydrogenase family)